MLHLFEFESDAIWVPPEGNPLGQKYLKGAWRCVMCRADLDFGARFGLDHGDDCPGLVRSADGDPGAT